MQNCQLVEESFVSEFTPMIKNVAGHLQMRLPPHILFDDLVQSGMLGLLEAQQRYNKKIHSSFEVFAYKRIRGAMLDYIRKSDWASRNTRKYFREAAEARHRIESTKYASATEREIADEMGISLENYQKILRDASLAQIFNIEDCSSLEESKNYLQFTQTPADDDYKQRLKNDLIAAINQLKEKERLVIQLYYNEDMRLKDVGEVLGVSESRACQIHGSAILTLQAKLRKWID